MPVSVQVSAGTVDISVMPTTTDYIKEIDSLETSLQAQKAQLRDLAMMGTVITAIHDIDAVLSVVMDMSLQLVHAEVGMIMIADGDDLKTEISWGVQEDFIRGLMYTETEDLPTYCFRHREAVVLSELDMHTESGILLTSLVALPIITQDKSLGVLILINKDQGGAFTEEDREVLAMLLNFVAVAIDNSNMMKEELRRQQMEQELAIAKQVQETILPQKIEEFQGVEIGASYFPAGAVSGDFYELIKIDEHRFYVVIGDVTNHGVPAALIMSACSGIIKSILSANPTISVSDLAGRVNNLLADGIIRDRDMFVTMFFACFDLTNRHLTFCNAGHLPGLYAVSDEGQVHELARGGPIIGQFADVPFTEGQRAIGAGDRLLLFTDGLTEACDAQGNMFGRERIEQIFLDEKDRHPQDFCCLVKKTVDTFSIGSAEETRDDFTVVLIKVK
ncbi:MAG: GAF domain-containing protein [Candidatus Zixiibacteriota bacterium]|nr:MAG: GAF domain-containing protein [candidate division Zixibacteria bacterium]